MAACDAEYKFTMIDVGAPSSLHDSSIFKMGTFGKAFLNNQLPIPQPQNLPETNIALPFFLVADQAFPLHENIMRPYPGDNLSQEKKVFNYRLSRARRTIENSFGILVQSWRILRKPIIAKISTCEAIIKACIVLHNFCKSEYDKKYSPPGFIDSESDNGEIIEGLWRQDPFRLPSSRRIGSNNASRAVQANRDTLCTYLNTVGTVLWQLERVYRGAVPI